MMTTSFFNLEIYFPVQWKPAKVFRWIQAEPKTISSPIIHCLFVLVFFFVYADKNLSELNPGLNMGIQQSDNFSC